MSIMLLLYWVTWHQEVRQQQTLDSVGFIRETIWGVIREKLERSWSEYDQNPLGKILKKLTYYFKKNIVCEFVNVH